MTAPAASTTPATTPAASTNPAASSGSAATSGDLEGSNLAAACECAVGLGKKFWPNDALLPLQHVAGRLDEVAAGLWPEQASPASPGAQGGRQRQRGATQRDELAAGVQGAVGLKANAGLCRAQCSDGTEFMFRACVDGDLIEINRLIFRQQKGLLVLYSLLLLVLLFDDMTKE